MGSLMSVCGRCGSFDRVQVGRVPVEIVGWENFKMKTSFSLKTRGEPWNLIRKTNTGIQEYREPSFIIYPIITLLYLLLFMTVI